MEKIKLFWTNHKEAIIVAVVSILVTIAVTKMFFNVTKKKR
jgi:hypothetical protein